MLSASDDIQDYVSTDMGERLPNTAFAWLEGVGDDSRYESLLVKELATVSNKAECTATFLPFKVLAALRTKSPQGFHRLLSMAPFLRDIVQLEKMSEKRVQG